MDVIIDTNMLMAIVQFKVDLFNELRALGARRFYIPRGVFEELESIRGSRPVAELVEKMLKEGKIATLKDGPVDDVILKEAERMGAAIATNDKELIKRAKSFGLKVIRLRQSKFLVVE